VSLRCFRKRYARRLKSTLGPRGVQVRNGEGILMWLHDGGDVVQAKSGKGGARTERYQLPFPPNLSCSFASRVSDVRFGFWV
jgi:hypothetical protein